MDFIYLSRVFVIAGFDIIADEISDEFTGFEVSFDMREDGSGFGEMEVFYIRLFSYPMYILAGLQGGESAGSFCTGGDVLYGVEIEFEADGKMFGEVDGAIHGFFEGQFFTNENIFKPGGVEAFIAGNFFEDGGGIEHLMQTNHGISVKIAVVKGVAEAIAAMSSFHWT